MMKKTIGGGGEQNDDNDDDSYDKAYRWGWATWGWPTISGKLLQKDFGRETVGSSGIGYHDSHQDNHDGEHPQRCSTPQALLCLGVFGISDAIKE